MHPKNLGGRQRRPGSKRPHHSSLFQREILSHDPSHFINDNYINDRHIERLGLEGILEGHEGCVNCIQWNERGTILASGSDDHRAILWDPFRRRKLHSIETGHLNNIFSVQFAPNTNDQILLTAAGDNRVRMHDLNRTEQDKCIQVYSCHLHRVKRLAVTATAPNLFWTAGEDGLVMEYDVRSGPTSCATECNHCLINMNAHAGGDAEVKSIAINPCRPELIAVGVNDPFVRVFDRRMLSTKRVSLPDNRGSHTMWNRQTPVLNFGIDGECYDFHPKAAQYYCAGHLPVKHNDYRLKFRPLATTHLTFSGCGGELLVNLGGEQLYLFDVVGRRTSLLTKLRRLLADVQLPLHDVPIEQPLPVTAPLMVQTNGCPTSDANGLPFGSHFLTTALDTNLEEPRRWSKLTPRAEVLKNRANLEFQKQHNYSSAIALYSQAIHVCSDSPLLHANRAAAYLKRQWDGDVYAALRDCYTALQMDPTHVKALFRLARCLHLLKQHDSALSCLRLFKARFPQQSNTSACSLLEVDVKTALFASADYGKRRRGSLSTPADDIEAVIETVGASSSTASAVYQQSQIDLQMQANAADYKLRFCGHCNTTTDIKEANYFGRNNEYIIAGSDDGTFFIWDRSTCNIVSVLRGDESIVNCLQPHPTSCMLATSGIESVIKLWSPRPEDGVLNEHQVIDVDTTASANQRRMNADPFEVMLYNIGYQMSGAADSPSADPDAAATPNPNEHVPTVQCRQS